MSFRVVVISQRSKLDYSCNYLVRHHQEEVKRVLLDEIKLIMINSSMVTITSTLLTECLNKKIRIIINDEKHNPVGEICSYHNNYLGIVKLEEQLSFKNTSKAKLRQEIIKKKIYYQSLVLKKHKRYVEANKLESYTNEVELDDTRCREGHAAKVYFNAIFGKDFSRDDGSEINAKLNYGYSLLVSLISRVIKISGFYSEIGIHHHGNTNYFNLSYDFVEPLRPLVDSFVLDSKVNELGEFKKLAQNILQYEVEFEGRKMMLINAVDEYVVSLFKYLKTDDYKYIRFINYEL